MENPTTNQIRKSLGISSQELRASALEATERLGQRVEQREALRPVVERQPFQMISSEAKLERKGLPLPSTVAIPSPDGGGQGDPNDILYLSVLGVATPFRTYLFAT